MLTERKGQNLLEFRNLNRNIIGYNQEIKSLVVKIFKKLKKKWQEKMYTSLIAGKKKVLLTCNAGNIRVTYFIWGRSLPQER